MPAAYDRQFALWLTQHGQPRAASVNVLEFVHPRWVVAGTNPTGSIWVSDYGDTFDAIAEDARAFSAQPIGLMVDLVADNLTTEQRLTIRLDNVNGLVMSQLRLLSPDDLQTPIALNYRCYLDSKRTAPAIDPAQLVVAEIKAMRTIVEIVATVDVLPNTPAGMRYILDNFPPLAYL